jgi:hypothetical protein
MGWRYQPVWTGQTEEERVYSVCEVYLDRENKLMLWAKDPAAAPVGEDGKDLLVAIAQMRRDCLEWEPVDHEKLETGQEFRRAPKRSWLRRWWQGLRIRVAR